MATGDRKSKPVRVRLKIL